MLPNTESTAWEDLAPVPCKAGTGKQGEESTLSLFVFLS